MPLPKIKISVGEIILLTLTFTVSFVIIIIVLGMINKGGTTTPENTAIRSKVLDLVIAIAGAVISTVSLMIGIKKGGKPPDET